MRLIDADALKDFYGKWSNRNTEYTKGEVDGYIDAQPTIEAEPVRHGAWERDPTDKNYFICSACGGFNGIWHEFADCTHKFCPWCGAKMDAKED